MDLESIARHKFLEDSCMTFQQVFDFAFKSLIPVLQELTRELGRDLVLVPIGEAASESALKAGQASAGESSRNDLQSYVSWAREPSRFTKHALTIDVVEDNPEVFELRISECLWAKTFREMGAADLGYALFCNTDYAHCNGFNPQITLHRTKTLMQGDDCCNHRYILGG